MAIAIGQMESSSLPSGDDRYFYETKGSTVDGLEIQQSPVEGKVVYPWYLQGFSTIPGG